MSRRAIKINVDVIELLSLYESGLYTIEDLAQKFSISTGKTYALLRDAGCSFSHKRRKPFREEERLSRSRTHKGKKLTPEHTQAIRERNSCNYNGLNGYGHTKIHNKGYVLAYAPHHPNAHKDGYVMLHTILMEQTLGRYLYPDEIVHHINHNRSDNRFGNLQLMTKHEHFSMHTKQRLRENGGTLCKKSI